MGRRSLLPRTGPSWRTLGQDSRRLEFRSGILDARVMFSSRGLEPCPGDVVLDVTVDRGPAPGVVRGGACGWSAAARGLSRRL